MKVDKSKARTPDEEFDYLTELKNGFGNFFACDVHPNRVKAAEVSTEKVRRKLIKLVATEEFLVDNPIYRRDY